MSLTRRSLFGGAAAAVALAAAPAYAAPTPVDAAYQHLDESMDEWGRAPALRLPSSYHRGFLDFWDNSVTYDDALVAIAYANRPGSGQRVTDSRTRARVIGDCFLQMQAKDPIGDGRLRNAYGPEDLFGPHGEPNIQTWGSATGNNAWAGMALMHIHRATGDQRYLTGAAAIAGWIIDHHRDTRGAGGFRGGYNSDGSAIRWKSTEHNIDAAGLFGMLATATKKSRWADAQAHARRFVTAMWDARASHFAIGTTDDGATVNTSEYIPEDVQSWASLLLRDCAYNPCLRWNIANLQVTDASSVPKPVTGVRFALQTNPAALDHNDDTVWLEGTAHMALALTTAGIESATSRRYLSTLETIQRGGECADGKGIQANSSEGYSGGDDINYTSLHTGATAWYILAATGTNPFHLAPAPAARSRRAS